jgi:hypothetical protein
MPLLSLLAVQYLNKVFMTVKNHLSEKLYSALFVSEQCCRRICVEMCMF